MSMVQVEIPEESLMVLGPHGEASSVELRMLAAVKLYELGRLSSGAAARLAGIPRVVFLARLANYGVATFRMTEEDLGQESPLA
jgi:predicted HTH domain antitoxin